MKTETQATAKCGHPVDGGTDARCGACWQAFKDGEAANDHNRGVYRKQRGTTKGNPHEVNSEAWKAWRDGYSYRDMVNDG